MPSLERLNTMSRREFMDALGGLFEHSPWVAEGALPARPFRSGAELHAKMVDVMRNAPFERALALLRAHPELAGRAMVSRTLTADSTNEQTRSGLTQCTPEEFARLQQLNTAYNAKFGWPFILAVRQLDRPTIIRTFAARLESSAADEFAACLANIETITRWRLEDLLAS
jgi:N-carbamoyl-L-amino-acid hydrolase